MRRLFFQKPNATVITAIMTGQTPESLIGQSRGAEFDGADAIATCFPDFFGFFKARGFTVDEEHAFTPMSTIVRYELGGH